MKVRCLSPHRALLPSSSPCIRSLSSLSVPLTPRPLVQEDQEDPLTSSDVRAHLLPCASAFSAGRTLAIAEVRALHACISKKPAFLSGDPYLVNSLVDAYRKAGCIGEARHLLGEIPHPNTISWNLSVSIHNQCSEFRDSLRSFCVMRQRGVEATGITYGSVLSACAMCGDAGFGKQLQALAMKNGFFSDAHFVSGLVDLLAKSGLFDEAVSIFLEHPTDNVVVWNTIIAGGVRNGENFASLYLFHRMVSGFCVPNGFTLSSVLAACTAAKELELGRGIHGWVIKCAAGGDVVLGTALVDLYAKCGDTDAAVRQFSRMPLHNVVTWTAIISAFAQEDPARALSFFRVMISTSSEINKYTITSVLAACGNLGLAKEALQVHCWILRSGFSTDPIVRASLVTVYAKAGEKEMSEQVFEEVEGAKDVALWAAMISGLVYTESLERCFQLFQKMLQVGTKPEKFCSCSLLSIMTDIGWGKQVHSYVIKVGLIQSVPVASALFTMYSKCGCLDDSFMLFKQMPERDGVAWTSMIAGLSEHGHSHDALLLFREMIINKVNPDHMTLSYCITACAERQHLIGGKEIHGHAFRKGFGIDVLVGSALISLYSKCKALHASVKIFHRMPEKDHFSWSSMISGYAQNGCNREAFLTFRQMQIDGFRLERFSCSSIIAVCADISSPLLGQQLHALVMKAGFLSDLSVNSAMITLYSKCGSIHFARRMFNEVRQPDLITWTAMIDGYSQNGEGEEALRIYNLMRNGATVPDSQTFASLLSACSHNGLVEEGFLLYNSMTRDYGIEPESHHFACIVDLLGRSGRLKEAVTFIDKMPSKPCVLIWSTLLGACRVYGDTEMGTLAAKKVLELDPSDSGAYISLSNISADLGDWKEASKIRNSMKKFGIRKEPGWSLVG